VARRTQRSGSHPGTPSDSAASSPEVNTANEIYDLTTEDDDGGMILNVEGGDPAPIVISDDEDSEQTEDEDDDGEHGDDDGIEELKDREGSHVKSRTLDDDLEEGEERENVIPTDATKMDVSQERDATATDTEDIPFVIDTNPSAPAQVCLKDLNPDQLEAQIRYAFWHLERHGIDLARPARCLHCQGEGHIDEKCPQKTCTHCNAYTDHESALCPTIQRCHRCREQGHMKRDCTGMKNTTKPCDLCSLPGHQEEECPLKHYIHIKVPLSEKVNLWISCCACGSRAHLVGDCPDIPREQAARWSLRSFDSSQIVNLSIQTGINKLEKEAENRNMRPTGMKIKGRAGMHHADAGRRDESDSDDLDFFSHPPISRDARPDPYRPQSNQRQERFDRFNPPARTDAYRPPRNGFYSTDSFGRPRSRSPASSRYNDYPRRRSPSFDRSSIDSWRPGNSFTQPNTRRGQSPSRAQQRGRPAQTVPKSGVPIQLPTRKGSNTSMRDASAGGQSNSSFRPPAQGGNQGSSNGGGGGGSQTKGQRRSLTRKQRRQARPRDRDK